MTKNFDAERLQTIFQVPANTHHDRTIDYYGPILMAELAKSPASKNPAIIEDLKKEEEKIKGAPSTMDWMTGLVEFCTEYLFRKAVAGKLTKDDLLYVEMLFRYKAHSKQDSGVDLRINKIIQQAYQVLPYTEAVIFVCSLFKHANSSEYSAKTLSTLLDILGKLDLNLILCSKSSLKLKQAALDLVLEVLPLAYAMQTKALTDLRALEDTIDEGRSELVVPVATSLQTLPDTPPNRKVQFVDSISKTLHTELNGLLKSAMEYRDSINKMLAFFISTSPKSLTLKQKGKLTLAFLSYRTLRGMDPYLANSIIDWVIDLINKATIDNEKIAVIKAIFKLLKDKSVPEEEKTFLLAQLAQKLNIPSQTTFAHLLAKDLDREFSAYSRQTRMQIFFRGFALSNVEHVNKQMMAILSDIPNFAVLDKAFVCMGAVIIDDETLNHLWSTVETSFNKSSAFAKLCILSLDELAQLTTEEIHALHSLADKFYRAHRDLHHNNTAVAKSNHKIKFSLKAVEHMLSKWDFERFNPNEDALTIKINAVTSLIPSGPTLKDDDQSSALSDGDLDYEDPEGAIFISLRLIPEKRQLKLYCPNSPRREIIVPLDDMTNAKLAALILNEFKHAQLAKGNRVVTTDLKVSEYNGYKRTASADRSITPNGRSMLHYQYSHIARASSFGDLKAQETMEYRIDQILDKIETLGTKLNTPNNVELHEDNKQMAIPAAPGDCFYGKPRM